MEERARHELVVGVVFLVGLFLFGFFLYFANYYGKILRTNTYTLVFDDVAGIAGGGPVQLAGARAGEVLSVEVQPNGKVFVNIALGKKFTLRKNYIYTIRSGLLLGQSTISINTTDPPGNVIPPGAIIPGTNPARPEDVIADVRETLQNVNQNLQQARELIGDPIFYSSLRTTLLNVSQASENAVRLTSSLASASAAVGAQAQALIEELRTSSHNLARATGSAADVLSNPALANNLLEMAGSLQKAAENLEQLTSKPELSQVVENLAAVSLDLKQTSQALNQMLTSGQGLANLARTLALAQETAGKLNSITTQVEALMVNPETTAAVRETLANAREASAKALQAASRANELLLAGKRAIEPAAGLRASEQSDFYFLPAIDHVAADLEVQLKSGSPERWLALGVQGVGEKTTANLKFGLSRGKESTLLWGIHRSKLGVTWRGDLSKKIGLTLDLYDPNRFRADLWATYRLSPDLYLGLGGLGLGQEDYLRYGLGLRK